MKLPESTKKFFNRWGNFFGTVFSPGSGVPLLICGICLYFGFTIDNFALTVVLSIIASVMATIAGIFLKDDWDKLQGNSLLEKKGLSALRNLKSISTQLCNLKEWIIKFEKSDKKNSNNLKEINRHISTIQLNITSGLQDWVDLIPELKKEIEQAKEEAKKYDDVVRAYQEELLKAKKEMLTISNDVAQKEEIEKKIKKLESEIIELKNDQQKAIIGASNSYILGTDSQNFFPSNSAVLGINTVSSMGLKVCSNCHNLYNESILSSGPFYIGRDLCEKCRKSSIT